MQMFGTRGDEKDFTDPGQKSKISFSDYFSDHLVSYEVQSLFCSTTGSLPVLSNRIFACCLKMETVMLADTGAPLIFHTAHS
jgi:hypothetical protein